MSPGLGYTPAKPTSPPTHRLKFVDKLFADEGFTFNSYGDAEARIRDATTRKTTGGAGGQAYVVPEFSTDADWRKDPSRHRPLGYSWRMPSEELKAILDLPKMRTPAGDVVCEAIVADAIVSAHLYPGRRISYSRRAEYWAARVRYTGKGFNRDTVTLAVDKLVERGILIEHDRRPPGRRGVQSSYLPNPMLAAFEMPKLNKQKGEAIILKDVQGNLLGYEDTPETRDQRYMLDKVNGVLSRTEFTIDREGIADEGQWLRIDDYLVFPTQTAMHRIYNGGWTLGGRFYGSFWMNMKGEDRQHILIDGGETVEVDYDQLHARIIYAEAKKKLVGDAYDIEGFERKVAKRAFFIVVNAKNFLDAKGAVADMLAEKGLDPKLSVKLIEAMKKRHHEVREFFHSGCGLRLQNLDSKMAEHILRVMTVRKGVPCLPIHDSFIVPSGQAKNLMKAMKEAYEKFVGKASASVCSIKNPPRTDRVKSKTCASQVHTYTPSAPDTSRREAYRTPTSEDSVLENLESVNRNTESSIAREEAKAEQPIIKRTIPMPSFLREAQELAAKAWHEDQARKQAKAESRQRGRQMGYGGKNGSAVVRMTEQPLARLGSDDAKCLL
ncbi:hypothetical protein [Ensifer adhaerens]|uniref:hypothetical protein n=1 Tax=Ensifer adhaerens TaxID=106592 RepID=UPI001C4E0705|nr:hypothetical protein [Ensifer adhaerens]MBW0366121.1 hypothetical protein [Ensifer adhaerens]UCM19984.1 hypothetical protein LDL63_19610 [Ensifer adhaerens]